MHGSFLAWKCSTVLKFISHRKPSRSNRIQVNPDEVIAYGCTIQAAMLDGLIGDLRLVRAPPRKKIGADAAAAYRAKRMENAKLFK